MVDIKKQDIIEVDTQQVQTKLRVDDVIGRRVYFTDIGDTNIEKEKTYYKVETIKDSDCIDLV